jgi:hypothetical protein
MFSMIVLIVLWPSYEEQTVDALVPRGDERRGKLR